MSHPTRLLTLHNRCIFYSAQCKSFLSHVPLSCALLFRIMAELLAANNFLHVPSFKFQRQIQHLESLPYITCIHIQQILHERLCLLPSVTVLFKVLASSLAVYDIEQRFGAEPTSSWTADRFVREAGVIFLNLDSLSAAPRHSGICH